MAATRPVLRPAAIGTVIVFGVLCGVGACSGSGGGAPTAPTTVAVPSTAPPPSTGSGPATSAASATPPDDSPRTDSFGLLEAMAAARQAEKGAVTDAELTRFGEASAWKVEVRRSRRVSVEVIVTGGGRVQARTEDDTDDEARDVPGYPAADAVEAAQGRVQGQPTAIELDSDGDRRVWEVTVSRPGDQPVTVTYDADSGKYRG